MNQKIILPIAGTEENYNGSPNQNHLFGIKLCCPRMLKQIEASKTTTSYFQKLRMYLIGHDSPIIYPNVLKEIGLERVDYEGELAVIVGKKGKNIQERGFR